jgi:hypothetical protein
MAQIWKNSPPMFLEFDLVFYIIFSDFLFFEISEFEFKKWQFLNSDPADPAEFQRFSENRPHF